MKLIFISSPTFFTRYFKVLEYHGQQKVWCHKSLDILFNCTLLQPAAGVYIYTILMRICRLRQDGFIFKEKSEKKSYFFLCHIERVSRAFIRFRHIRSWLIVSWTVVTMCGRLLVLFGQVTCFLVVSILTAGSSVKIDCIYACASANTQSSKINRTQLRPWLVYFTDSRQLVNCRHFFQEDNLFVDNFFAFFIRNKKI